MPTHPHRLFYQLMMPSILPINDAIGSVMVMVVFFDEAVHFVGDIHVLDG